ncbi:flagellar brake protein [Clostridium vincentii]|uniref:Flagellar brake protein YcgR n=1 Tax=Clostridium vincentii TaxID=52704 RepID=A0A2T0BJG2_9CLOT|nr:flagellar brake protein [Clostridium vincentii]PRR83963.1 Flagellar brake protein YcgR [Clostridium vincentii]
MENLKININGNLLVLYEDKYYKSTVQDVNEEEFIINMPVEDGVYLTLNSGDDILVDYFSDDGFYYEFAAKVISRLTEKNMPMYKISRPIKAIKIQRRDFVRVSFTEPTVYKIDDNKKCEWKPGLLLDLSGGGLKIKLKEKIKLSGKIIIKISCGNDVYEILGKTIRCDKSEDGEYVCGIEFKEIDERKRDKIVQKVFSVMRKQRELL